MRNIEIVELLLDKGAKVSAVDKVLHATLANTRESCEDMSVLLLYSVVIWSFL